MVNIQSLKDIKNAFYINLASREDRKTHLEEQMQIMGINAQRFNAIQMKNGAVGCTLSHLRLLEDAIEKKMDHILIMEDDIQFLSPDLFKRQFQKFCGIKKTNWDVVLFGGNNMPPFEYVDDTCVRVSRCQTTTGYLVNGHYIRTLSHNIRRGLTLLINNPKDHSAYAIDKYWFNLQLVGKWYLIIPLSVVQFESYSDIEKKETSYRNIMLDLDKKVMFDAIRKSRLSCCLKV